MDIALLMQGIQLAMKYGPTVVQIIQTATSNASISERIEKTAPDIANVLIDIGSTLFPKAAPELRMAAGAIASFDKNYTVWLQKSLNAMVTPSPNLEVDGIYGAKTRDAVEKLQKQLGLKIDGVAGKLTQAAISTALANVPQIK